MAVVLFTFPAREIKWAEVLSNFAGVSPTIPECV